MALFLKSFDLATREKLVTVLKDQYRNVSATEAIIENINSLENKETFTITTGHQLNLFTGPLYFLYKIISTINLYPKIKILVVDDNSPDLTFKKVEELKLKFIIIWLVF